MTILFSTTKPASPACQPPARIYFEAPDDALLARVTEKVAELMGRHLSYVFHDEAPGGVTPIVLEDVGPSALPVPSAAVALGDDLRDGLVAISKAVADQDGRAAQAMLREILAAPQPSPTPPTQAVEELIQLKAQAKQDKELILQLVETLASVDAAMPFPVARQVLKVARARLEQLNHH